MSTLAARQLASLEQVGRGAIQILGTIEAEDRVQFTISLDTHGIATAPGGIRTRDREKFLIVVPDTFPYKPPSILVEHTRWAGTAHVQWGRHLCIYAAPSVEWDPADGMRGLIARLTLWLERAAAGTLDPDGQPLHPPVAYPTASAGRIIIHPDLAGFVPWSQSQDVPLPETVLAWCVADGDRVDVVEWMTYPDALDRIVGDEFVPSDSAGRFYFVAPCVLIHDQIGFEYPKTADALAKSLTGSGVDREALLLWLARVGLINRHIWNSGNSGEVDFPTIVLLGTPSRRLEGNALLAHLSAWRFSETGSKITELLSKVEFGALDSMKPEIYDLANSWLDIAGAEWMTVYEDRPEVTRRRDGGTSANWLLGKRVLILGCGALGAPIAEHCVRAGVAQLMVMDNGVVGPGILVRQPYSDADIGEYKSKALAARLSIIRRDLSVTSSRKNVLSELGTINGTLDSYDLIIDATADVGVRTALEHARGQHRDLWPHVITVIIGHTAERGLAAVSPAGASGGGLDIFRRVSLHARTEAAADWRDVSEDFFPDEPRTDLFFPEPGCSAPTFVGSSAQVSALASALLTGALNVITTGASESDSTPSMTAIGCRLPGASPSNASTISWPSDIVLPDAGPSDFEIRISATALSEIRAEVRRGFRLRGAAIETGGMLLGAFDEAAQILHIDVAAGPPPDSALSAIYFGHGTEGTQDILEYHRRTSANATSFVGMWHSHPMGEALPSPTDKHGMAQILRFSGTGRRALMLIVGGKGDIWTAWRDSDGMPTFYVQVVERTGPMPPEPPLSNIPAETMFFPGGFGYRPSAVGTRPHWWNRRSPVA